MLSSGILKFCIRGQLGEQQENTLTELCDVVCLLCQEPLYLRTMDTLEYRVHKVLSLLERDFPVSVHVVMIHLMHHVPQFLRRFGPLRGYWMYPMERFNNWIKSRNLNVRYPESTVIETYHLYELGYYLQVTKQLPTGATIDIGMYTSSSDQDEVDENLENDCCGCGRQTTLDQSHISDLNRLYMHTYSEYRNAVIEYEKGTVEKRDGQLCVMNCRRDPIARNHATLLNLWSTLSRTAMEGLSHTGHFFLKMLTLWMFHHMST